MRGVREPLAGAVVMACIVALVRAALVSGEVGQALTLAGSVASGVVSYLTWLWLTDSRAIEEVRLAWARVARVRGGGMPEG